MNFTLTLISSDGISFLTFTMRGVVVVAMIPFRRLSVNYTFKKSQPKPKSLFCHLYLTQEEEL